MGGYGSGSWQSGRATTSACRALDLRQLRRRGMLSPGHVGTWNWSINGEPYGSIGIFVEADRLDLRYRFQCDGDEWRDVKCTVRLDWTPCNYGGRRAWLHCPVMRCARRVAVLYMGSGGVFACRRCYRLAYIFQREKAGDRYTRRADKLRQRLGWEPGILSGEEGKPKGMHWRTFERMTGDLDAYTDASMWWVVQRFGLAMP